MSRVILFAAFVAFAICCASSVSAGDNHGCSANQVWEQCPNECTISCPNTIPADFDCGVISCTGKCICKPGYLLRHDGFCVFPDACE